MRKIWSELKHGSSKPKKQNPEKKSDILQQHKKIDYELTVGAMTCENAGIIGIVRFSFTS